MKTSQNRLGRVRGVRESDLKLVSRPNTHGTATGALIVAVAVVLAGFFFEACTSNERHTQQPGGTDVSVKITPSKPQYARGEQIVLSIEVTNIGTQHCRMSRTPEGSVTFVSLTRDAQAVVPALSYGKYTDGFSTNIRENLIQLAPGKSLIILMKSGQNVATGTLQALETSTLGPLDEASLAFWSVDEPGTYSLSARYVLPCFAASPSDVCGASRHLQRR